MVIFMKLTIFNKTILDNLILKNRQIIKDGYVIERVPICLYTSRQISVTKL